MSKILEIFSERHKKGQIYRNVPIKTDDNVHPLNYVYPDTEDSVTEDVVLGEESVSLTRDVDRIKKFEETHAGGRFLDKQILLQRSNLFQYAREYRGENLKDHVNPMEHQSRHVISDRVQRNNTFSIPGEFTFVTGDVGKLQTETADKLISSFSPVFFRLSSKEGMLNSGGEYETKLNFFAQRVRRDAARRINKFLAPITEPIEEFRTGIFGTAAPTRPENELGYLEQLFNQNKALQRTTDGGRYGHIYLSLSSQDYSGTYREAFSAGDIRSETAPGLSNLQSLRENDFRIINFSLDRQFNSIVHDISRKIHRKVRQIVDGAVQSIGFDRFSGWLTNVTGGRVKLPNPARAIADYVTKFLPRSQDILLLRHIRRFAINIDNVIAKVNTFGSVLLTPEWGASDILKRYGTVNEPSRVHAELLKGVAVGVANVNEVPRDIHNSYIDALQRYKGEANKTISIGFAGEAGANHDGKGFLAHNSEAAHAQSEEEQSLLRKPGYYKDWMQADNPSIYRDPTSRYDSDSIDVIMRVMGRSDEDVRFRAFIQDITETVTPTYNENKYIGRHETFYTYDRVTRDVGFSLTLHAFSMDERDVVMQKMAYLTSLAYPLSSGEHGGPGYLTPLVTELTIGNLYRKQPCIVQTLTHTIESDASWDIDRQTTMTIAVTMGIRLLDKKLYTHQRMGDEQFTLYLKDVKTLHEIRELTSQANVENQSIVDRMLPPNLDPKEGLLRYWEVG